MKAICKHINLRNFICSFLTLYFIFDVITSLCNLLMDNMAEQQLILSDISFSFKLFYIMQSFIEALVLSSIMAIMFKCHDSVVSTIKGLTADEIIGKLSAPEFKYDKQSDKHIIVYKNGLRKYYFGEIHLVLSDNEWRAIGSKPQIKKLQDFLDRNIPNLYL